MIQNATLPGNRRLDATKRAIIQFLESLLNVTFRHTFQQNQT